MRSVGEHILDNMSYHFSTWPSQLHQHVQLFCDCIPSRINTLLYFQWIVWKDSLLGDWAEEWRIPRLSPSADKNMERVVVVGWCQSTFHQHLCSILISTILHSCVFPLLLHPIWDGCLDLGSLNSLLGTLALPVCVFMPESPALFFGLISRFWPYLFLLCFCTNLLILLVNLFLPVSVCQSLHLPGMS